MTENEANMSIKYAVCVLEAIGNGLTLSNENDREEACAFAIQALEEIQQYRAIGTVEDIQLIFSLCKDLERIVKKYEAIDTIEEFKALKEKNNKDFELLLKCVKESYPMFKGAYVELDVFMGDVMRRFTRDRKQS